MLRPDQPIDGLFSLRVTGESRITFVVHIYLRIYLKRRVDGIKSSTKNSAARHINRRFQRKTKSPTGRLRTWIVFAFAYNVKLLFIVFNLLASSRPSPRPVQFRTCCVSTLVPVLAFTVGPRQRFLVLPDGDAIGIQKKINDGFQNAIESAELWNLPADFPAHPVWRTRTLYYAELFVTRHPLPPPRLPHKHHPSFGRVLVCERHVAANSLPPSSPPPPPPHTLLLQLLCWHKQTRKQTNSHYIGLVRRPSRGRGLTVGRPKPAGDPCSCEFRRRTEKTYNYYYYYRLKIRFVTLDRGVLSSRRLTVRFFFSRGGKRKNAPTNNDSPR